jgi:peptide/nickel transport system ATP-binding protein/oligopeptide transport system ATP-binding protein
MPDNDTVALIRTKNLRKYFVNKRDMLGRPTKLVKAVDDVTLTINRGETLGVVGESGCGKSTLGRVIIRLLDPTHGDVFFKGVNISGLGQGALREYRRDMQIIFQDPYASLNPMRTVFESVREALIAAHIGTRAQRDEMTADTLGAVGLNRRQFHKYPHEMSGGQRQRVAIARAVITNPSFVVCDEPVSALDASVRAQVLNLINELRVKKELAYMFISHDMSVVRHVSDRVMVMYMGKVLEVAAKRELFDNPVSPYTRVLLSAIPIPDVSVKVNRLYLGGEVTSPINPPPGCRLCPRCPHAAEVCGQTDPELRDVGGGHFVACHQLDRM